MIQFLVVGTEMQTKKAFYDEILERYLERQQQAEQVEFMIPAKSGKCRTVWLDNSIIKKMKKFAAFRDVSENAVIFTAVKRYLLDNSEANHA